MDDCPMLDTPGKAKSCRPASSKLLSDLGAQKVQVKLRDGSWEKDQWSQEGERGPNEKSNCNVR